MSSNPRWAAVAAFLFVALAATALAQSTASLRGSVTDPQGSALAGARSGPEPGDGRGKDGADRSPGEYPAARLSRSASIASRSALDGFQAEVVTDLRLQVAQTGCRTCGWPSGA